MVSGVVFADSDEASLSGAPGEVFADSDEASLSGAPGEVEDGACSLGWVFSVDAVTSSVNGQ